MSFYHADLLYTFITITSQRNLITPQQRVRRLPLADLAAQNCANVHSKNTHTHMAYCSIRRQTHFTHLSFVPTTMLSYANGEKLPSPQFPQWHFPQRTHRTAYSARVCGFGVECLCKYQISNRKSVRVPTRQFWPQTSPHTQRLCRHERVHELCNC